MDVDAVADILQHEKRKLAAKVLAELVEAGQHLALVERVAPVERLMIDGKLKAAKH